MSQLTSIIQHDDKIHHQRPYHRTNAFHAPDDDGRVQSLLGRLRQLESQQMPQNPHENQYEDIYTIPPSSHAIQNNIGLTNDSAIIQPYSPWLTAAKAFIQGNSKWLLFITAVVVIIFVFEYIHPQPMMHAIDAYIANISHIPHVSMIVKSITIAISVILAHTFIVMK